MNSYKVNFSGKLFYGMGNAGYGVVSQTVNNFIMFFGTAVLAIPGSLMGIAIALSVMWDAFTDPIAGSISDRARYQKFGRRHGFMIIGCIGMAFFNILLWTTPAFLPVFVKFIWILLILILLETCNTFFITPYTALGTELVDDYNERTGIQSLKTVFFLVGLIVPTLLMGALFSEASGGISNYQNYVWLAVCTSSICIFLGMTCILGTFKYIPYLKIRYQNQPPEPLPKFTQSIKNFFITFKQKNFRAIILGYSLSLVSAAFLTGVGLHVFEYSFHLLTSQTTILMAFLITATIISQLFWYLISKKFEKKNALLCALGVCAFGIICFALTFILKTYINKNYLFWCLAFSVFVCGFGTGALYSLPISMYADLIAIERSKTSSDKSATYTSFLTFAYKIANALTLVIIGIALDIIGFDASASVQLASVQQALGWLLIIGVALSIIVSFFFYSKFNLTKKDVEINSKC